MYSICLIGMLTVPIYPCYLDPPFFITKPKMYYETLKECEDDLDEWNRGNWLRYGFDFRYSIHCEYLAIPIS